MSTVSDLFAKLAGDDLLLDHGKLKEHRASLVRLGRRMPRQLACWSPCPIFLAFCPSRIDLPVCRSTSATSTS